MYLIPPPAELPPGSVVWCYLRDSGGENQDVSVPQQLRVIEPYCAQHGLVIGRTFADVAKSGTSDVGREQFMQMIDEAGHYQNPAPNGILYWSTARFARNETDAVYYRAILRKNKLVLHSLTEPIPGGPFAQVVESLLDYANAQQSRANALQVRRAQEQMAQQGFSTGGLPPRCYKIESVVIGYKRSGQPRTVSRWVPDPELWELGKLAWRMRAEGHSLLEIVRATQGRIYKSKHCFTSFFTNRTYLGIGKYGDMEIPNHHEPLVDVATWDAVQAIIKSKTRESHPSFVRSPSLLSGIAICQHCGAAMMHRTTGANKWSSYICTRLKTQGKEACPNARSINRHRADAAVLNALIDHILTPDQVGPIVAEAQRQLADTSKLEMERNQLERDLEACKRAIANLLDLAETFGATAAADRLRQRETDRMRIEAQLQQITAKIHASNLTLTPEAVELILANWRTQVATAATGDLLPLRALVGEFVAQVAMDYSQIAITYHYPITSLGTSSSWGHFLQACNFLLLVQLR